MAITTMAVYDINNYLKNDSTIQSIAGKTMNFYAIIGNNVEAAPFVTYIVSPAVFSVEKFWDRRDAVTYSIFDTDIDRMLKIGERFIEMLSKGDAIADSGGKEGTDVRLLSTYFVSSLVSEAIERDGWFRLDLEFIIYYVAK